MAGKFQIKQRSNGEFQFTLDAANGQTVLTSEGYKAKAACLAGIESVRKNSQDEARFKQQTAKDGRQYFTLNASNGQAIGSSQMYADASGCSNGVSSVRSNAADAEIVDQTAG